MKKNVLVVALFINIGVFAQEFVIKPKGLRDKNNIKNALKILKIY